MRCMVSTAVLSCVMSSALWAQLGSTAGGGDFGGMGGGHLAATANVSVDISAEIRQLRASQQPPQPASPVGEATAPPTDSLPKAAVDASVQEAEITNLLQQSGSFDFVDTPLRDVAEWFQKTLGLDNIAFDRLRLEDEGIDPRADTVTFSAKEMSYRAALHHILRPLNLTTVVEDETLLITSVEHAEETLGTRVYPVWDLVQPIPSDPTATADYDTLIKLITTTVEPNSWDDVGGPASIDVYQGMLLISNRSELHTTIERLINALRTFSPVALRSSQPISVVDVELHAQQDLVDAFLNRRVHLSFENTPLQSAISSLQPASPVSFVIDAQALEDEGIDASSDGITLDAKDVTVDSGLRLMLRDLQLAYVFQHEALMITSREAAEETLQTKVYGCAGLINPLEPRDLSLRRQQLEELMQVVAQTVATSTWDEVGGPGSMVAFPQRGLLVMSQTADVHKQVGSLLRALHQGRQGHPGSAPPFDTSRRELTMRSYRLSSTFQSEDAQGQLIKLLESLLRGSENEVNNSAANEFWIRAIPHRLVISHRREAQQVLHRLLWKLGALATTPAGFDGDDFGDAF